jgi:hypothetical protein
MLNTGNGKEEIPTKQCIFKAKNMVSMAGRLTVSKLLDGKKKSDGIQEKRYILGIGIIPNHSLFACCTVYIFPRM